LAQNRQALVELGDPLLEPPNLCEQLVPLGRQSCPMTDQIVTLADGGANEAGGGLGRWRSHVVLFYRMRRG
jgi:hypothetical protein